MSITFAYEQDYEVVANTATITMPSFACPAVTDGVLIVIATFNNPRTVSGMTFNGLPLTKITNYVGASFFSNGEMWYLKNPPNVTANIVVTLNSAVSGRKEMQAMVFSGVDQTTPIDVFNSSYASSGTAANISLTTTVDNCWLVGGWKSDSGNFTAGANTTFRSGVFPSAVAGDSNGPKTPAGSHSLNATLSVSGDKGILAAALRPAAAPAPASTGFFNFF